ncbi:competence F-like domain protein [Rickettsia rhipicephali str. Ect]|uniref:Competence F-like domain protein n=2 Tax=spotted fever group TaxID=114277 RepID=A0A0F3PJG5_RICRH|nr:hypothetical protein RMB_03725 [Rickettsia massiliae str. AZT80]KJV79344.1 competence F-like domain protein [Rickettsia rhipicephali str. Ect]
MGEKVAKAYDPVDKLQQGAKIKEKGPPSPGLADKALNKIRTLPGGETAANVLEKTYKTLGSKAVRRAARIGGVAVSLVLNPTPVGVGLAALSLLAVAYNVGKETLEVKEDKRLDRKKKTLENIKANFEYVKQVELVVTTRIKIALNLKISWILNYLKCTKSQTFLSRKQHKNNIKGSIKFNTKYNIVSKKNLISR